MNYEIDCLGLICPVPVVKANIGYKRLKYGDSLTIVTDHSCTSQNLKETFKNKKCKIDILEEINGIWKITITKLD